ncbi:MAG: response regulator [Myxococcales bacterium]|nr:response regulator [Myxococcales bacterium]
MSNGSASNSTSASSGPTGERRHVASLSWHLQRVLLMVALWFGVLAVIYLVAPPLQPGVPIAILSVGVAIGCGLVAYLDRHQQGRRAQALAFLAATVIALHPLGVVALSARPEQTVVVIICMLGAAGAVPSGAVSAYFVSLLVFGWFAVRPPMAAADALHWSINVVVAAVASVIIAATRERFVRTIVGLAYQGEEARRMLEAQTRDLAEARDAALDSARAKGRFLANMSHEIRTPLNGIVGMLSLLRRTPLGRDQSEYLNEVLRSSELLMAIVNDILDVSKIEAGAVELELVAFDIAQLIEEVASAHAATAQNRGIELIADVDANLPKQVVGDPLRVRQIVTNLVSNALKFTVAGEVVVAARVVANVPDGRVRLRLAVSDTGVGIPADKLGSIFNAFSQADTSTTRRFGGTGLGLSICRQLVELMGGVLDVTSEPGQGSCFSFELELEKEDLRSTRGVTVNPRLWEARVLVMDASERMRLTLQSQLGAWGVETELAPSPKEAMRLARARADRDQAPFDVAIVDVTSLGRPVTRAAQELGAVLAPLGTVMVAMGSALGELRQQLPLFGFAADLPKPIHRNRLLEALNVALASAPIYPSASPSLQELTEGLPLSSNPPGPADVAPSGQRVLVVEDNETNQRVAVAQLRALGYATDVVGDGVDAVRALGRADHGYSCVLMDGQMPAMDGYEATREVRALEARTGRARVPIVALTANAMPGDRERAIDSGMDAYLAKPFTLAQLEAVLQDCWTNAPHPLPSRSMDTDGASGSDERVDWRQILDEAIVGQLKALESVSPGFFSQVVQTYLATSDENLRDLLSAAESGDLHATQRRAHALVGSSRQVGAMTVGALCVTIEHAATSTEAEAALASLPAELRRAQRALRAAVESAD